MSTSWGALRSSFLRILILLTLAGCGGQAEQAAQPETDGSGGEQAQEASELAYEPESSGEAASANSELPPFEAFSAEKSGEPREMEAYSLERPRPDPTDAHRMREGEMTFEPSIDQPPIAETAEEPTLADGYTNVQVFFATDRVPLVPSLHSLGAMLHAFRWTAVVAGGGLFLFLVGCFVRRGRVAWVLLAVIAFLASGAMGFGRFGEIKRHRDAARKDSKYYSDERGDLVFGTVNVTIPKTHELGQLESPSVFRLEFAEDRLRHVIMETPTEQTADEFFDELHSRVQQAPERDVFVFVHGYNVTFENALRRTAQIAYDVEFEGVPITYSWPAMGKLLAYTYDKESALYTSEHLEAFLISLREQSGADSINLVAHSMGNLALTAALKDLAKRQQAGGQMEKWFNEVILAAPDVPVDLFKQRVTNEPRIIDLAERVTLYASSNDRALLISKQLQGFHRAGESGAGLVVLDGVETIDVSQVDGSLLGHSYIGDSGEIIRDVRHVLLLRQMAQERTWLQPATRDNLPYWIFPKAANPDP